MTALPQPPAHLLTVAEYAELGETETGCTELVGRLLRSPSPVPDQPGFSRRPDLVVVHRAARGLGSGTSEVVVVIEIVSPGSRITALAPARPTTTRTETAR